jgi:hypothetical protein
MVATRAGAQMASQRRRATCGDGPQHVEPLVAQPRAVLFPEAVSLGTKDVSHLYGRPHHLTSFPMIAAACLANAGELQTLQSAFRTSGPILPVGNTSK